MSGLRMLQVGVWGGVVEFWGLGIEVKGLGFGNYSYATSCGLGQTVSRSAETRGQDIVCAAGDVVRTARGRVTLHTSPSAQSP